MMFAVLFFVRMVYEKRFFQDMEKQKTDNERSHRPTCGEVRLAEQIKNLRKYVERNQRQDDSRRKPEEEMQLVFKPECKQSPQKGGEKCDNGVDNHLWIL